VGLGYHDVRAMLTARRAGVSFDRVVTLGRQSLCLHRREIRTLSREFGLRMEGARPTWAGPQFGDYSDEFFRQCLGTTDLRFLDVSNYQGASLIHDMNDPVPTDWYQRFDAVVDGGTLEHVFSVPQALANMMRLASVGGHIFSTTPANNLCGHGFYQFSPELMFRAFARPHGFRLLRVALLEERYPGTELAPTVSAYSVRDPKDVGRRAGLISRRPILISVEAEKIAHLDEPFVSASTPQQSDYTAQWHQGGVGRSGLSTLAAWYSGRAVATHSRIVSSVLQRLPFRLRLHLFGLRLRWKYSLRNRRAYTPVSE
jgi:hypothetical protein